MKKILIKPGVLSIIISANLLISSSIFAQSPESMSYQAIVRNSSDVLVTNTLIGMQISIIQDSATGTAVYVETHTPTTNANGLVSIEIGNGTVVSGDFTTIDWASGPYFLKTETDPTGSTSYTITGTSQLLSVPYALYAKTAENITETDPIFGASLASGITAEDTANWNNKLNSYTETDPIYSSSVASGISTADTSSWNNKLDSYVETDPVFGSSVASGITGTDTTNWNNKLDSYTETDPVFGSSVAGGITGTDTTNWNNKIDAEVDGSVTNELQTISRTGLTVTLSNSGGTYQDSVNTFAGDTGIIIANNVVYEETYKVGDYAQGGIVFWVDETGEHGLACAKSDQSPFIRWYAGTNGYTRATGDGPYAGEMNTAIIISAHVAIGDDSSTYAARLCDQLEVTQGGKTYGDWYLPSKEEVNLMYENKDAIDATATSNGGTAFSASFYWSSTEYNDLHAWDQRFSDGLQLNTRGKYNTSAVRAIRAF